jgi:hypothetical protein
MVTPLSSSIVHFEGKAKIKNATHHKHAESTNKLQWQFERRRKHISNDTADREDASQVVTPMKRLRARKVEENAKRRKIEERNFQAHNVKNDLVDDSVRWECSSRSPVIAGAVGSIEMSNVGLVMAKDHGPGVANDIHLGWDTSAYIDRFSVYASLMDVSKPFYQHNHKCNHNHHKARFQRKSQWRSTETNSASSTITSSSTGTSSISRGLNMDSKCKDDDIVLTSSILLRQNELLEREGHTAAHDNLTSERNSMSIFLFPTITHKLSEKEDKEEVIANAKGCFGQAVVVID